MIISKQDAKDALRALGGRVIERDGEISVVADPALGDFIEWFIMPLLVSDVPQIADPEDPMMMEDWELDLLRERIFSIAKDMDLVIADSDDSDDNRLFIIFDTWNQVRDFSTEYLRRHRPISYALGYPANREGEFNPDRMMDYICGWGFSDEHSICNNCMHVIRTSPTHYGWQPDFFDFEGERYCGDCIRGDEGLAEEYVMAHIWTNKLAYVVDNLGDYGFTMLDLRYEHGLHYGQNDDPRRIAKALKAIGVPCIFTGRVGQFDVNWNVWIADRETFIGLKDSPLEEFYIPTPSEGWLRHMEDYGTEEEWEQTITNYLLNADTKLPYDPGREMAKALRGESTRWVEVTEDTSQGFMHRSLQIVEEEE